MKIFGFWSGHDASACVLDDGRPQLHLELERHTRVKEGPGDSIKLLTDHWKDMDSVLGIATCFQPSGIMEYQQTWNVMKEIAPLYVCGHHEAHAAHAFYSSNFENAVILTTDGGGIENAEGFTAGITGWSGVGTRLHNVFRVPLDMCNVGGIWSRCTRYIFGYEAGWPYGNQSGTTMALAALGDPQKYINDFRAMFYDQEHMSAATMHPIGHVKGMSSRDPKRPRHPYLGKFEDVAKVNEQAKFDMAASLQLATEEYIFKWIEHLLNQVPGAEYLCLAGGVSLNSVMTGKIIERFPQLKAVFIPPVPYDGGLTLGAAQWTWHHRLGGARVKWDGAFPTYLGNEYTKEDVIDAIKNAPSELHMMEADDVFICDRIAEGAVVSVYNGRAESGRRALGNRSILADPRNAATKDRVNERVKKRQSFRPFAPSILREKVTEWFERDIDAPYMEFVIKFREEKRELVPAVVHFDGSARLQTVSQENNPWYYSFIKTWESKTGVPIILNTSFNDREPIVNSPIHAVNCFCKTDIDFVYFPEYKIVACKR